MGENFAGAGAATPELDWGYWSEPVIDGRRVRLHRGRLAGGSSMVNGCVAVRAAPADFAEWERLGATGWSWEAVLPHYRRVESEVPIRVYAPESWQPIQHAFVEGFIELGFRPVSDINAPESWDGVVGAWPQNRRNEIRMGTLVTHVRPARLAGELPAGRPCARRSRADRARTSHRRALHPRRAAARDRGGHCRRRRRQLRQSGAASALGARTARDPGRRGSDADLRPARRAEPPRPSAVPVRSPGAALGGAHDRARIRGRRPWRWLLVVSAAARRGAGPGGRCVRPRDPGAARDRCRSAAPTPRSRPRSTTITATCSVPVPSPLRGATSATCARRPPGGGEGRAGATCRWTTRWRSVWEPHFTRPRHARSARSWTRSWPCSESIACGSPTRACFQPTPPTIRI